MGTYIFFLNSSFPMIDLDGEKICLDYCLILVWMSRSVNIGLDRLNIKKYRLILVKLLFDVSDITDAWIG